MLESSDCASSSPSLWPDFQAVPNALTIAVNSSLPTPNFSLPLLASYFLSPFTPITLISPIPLSSSPRLNSFSSVPPLLSPAPFPFSLFLLFYPSSSFFLPFPSLWPFLLSPPSPFNSLVPVFPILLLPTLQITI